MDEFTVSQGKLMRYGYTTGSCAAAASKAATAVLLSGQRLETVRLDTPKGMPLSLRVLDLSLAEEQVTCAIRKDSGDDPDDTNGMLVYATVAKLNAKSLKEALAAQTVVPGQEAPIDGLPCYCRGELITLTTAEPQTQGQVYICGGQGVGRVTKPGLSCQVGGPAINPVPRKMITQAVQEVMQQHSYTGNMLVTITMPQGPEIAKKTFNPRLGIIGGLSVLGTSGIVEPMSDRALIETMYAELDSRKANGYKDLLVFFGNYGEDFARDTLKLDVANAVTCSNFVGELLDYAVLKGFESLLIIGHSGKLVKLAQGVMNTHSKYADCRTELMALMAVFHGASPAVAKEIYQCLTTDEVTKVLKREGLFETVMAEITAKIDFYMQHRVHGKLRTGAMMFSNVYGVMSKTKEADALIKKLSYFE